MKAFTKLHTFPFKVLLNLKPLIAFWENLAQAKNPLQARIAAGLIDSVNKYPDLHANEIDLETIEKHSELISVLMTGVFSPYQIEHNIAGANVPYTMQNIYLTPGFEQTFGKVKNGFNQIVFGEEEENFYGPALHAYSMVIKKYFNLDITFDIPVFQFKFKDENTRLVNFYSISNDVRFVNFKYTGARKSLSPAERKVISENYFDLSTWMKILPPEEIIIEGFGLFEIRQNNLQQSVSSIQNKLLEKESIIKTEEIFKIEKRIKSLLSLPDVRMGVAVFNEDPKSFMLFRNTWHTVLKDPNLLCNHYQDSVYHKAALEGSPLVVSDLKALPEKTIIEEQLINDGFRSIIVIPLHYDHELVGLIELADPQAGALSTNALVKLHQVLPAFGIAAKRQAIDLENRIKAKIQEEYTAIHPAVEWKFEEMATEQLNREFLGEKGKKQQIIFRDVFPLYGASDVKSSSTKRNEAIRADLIGQLEVIDNVIKTVKNVRPLPILDHFGFNLTAMKKDIENDISSGDEVKILNYIRNEVEPVLKHLGSLQEELEGVVGVYFDMLDKELGILYRQRKDFEESMRMINDEVSQLIDKREEEAQKMYPHYFEKYRTDGVEYSIYIGESLVRNQPFDEIYLKNIRLWQLMLMCEITRATSKLSATLPLSLETTQLVLVHSQPIAIRFRDDEKKFDVEGAYNLRYEITKKRIDKATVKGTSERIVAPGHIAIIYAQETEREEYTKFINYLIAINYLDDDIETYELEDMQGIYGLNALRVKVRDEYPGSRKKSFQEIEKAVAKLETGNLS